MATSSYQRANSTNRSVGDNVTAARQQNFNQELDALFQRLDDRDLSITRDVLEQVTQIVDNINSVTVNIDWTDFNADTPKLYVQEAGDSNRFTITYSSAGYPDSIVYGP